MHSKTKIQEKSTLPYAVLHTQYKYLKLFEIKFDPLVVPIVRIVFGVILMSSIEKCQCSLIAIINSNELKRITAGMSKWTTHQHLLAKPVYSLKRNDKMTKSSEICINNPWTNVANSSFRLKTFFRCVFRSLCSNLEKSNSTKIKICLIRDRARLWKKGGLMFMKLRQAAIKHSFHCYIFYFIFPLCAPVEVSRESKHHAMISTLFSHFVTCQRAHCKYYSYDGDHV